MSKKRRKSRGGGGSAGRGPKRKTRAMLEAERRGPRTFAGLLEEAEAASLEEGGPPAPAYLSAAVGPQVRNTNFCQLQRLVRHK